MVGRKLTYKSWLRASTILEVVISMVIILLVFTIAMMISANVVRSSLSAKKIKAQSILQGVLIEIEQSKDITSKTVQLGDFKIDQEITPDINFSGLLNVHLIAYDINNEKIVELRKLIIDKK